MSVLESAPGWTDQLPELPTPMAVREVLEALLGRDVVPKPGAPFAAQTGGTTAVYVDDQRRPVAVLALDLAASAVLGAALGLVPRGGAEAAVEDGELPPNLRDNVAELLNIMAPLVITGTASHGRLFEVHPSGTDCPEDVAAALRRPTVRLDLVIDVAGYGPGGFSLLRV